MKIIQTHVAPAVDAVAHEPSLYCACGTTNTYGFAANGDVEIQCLHHPLVRQEEGRAGRG